MLPGRTLKRTAEKWPENDALIQGDTTLTYSEWNSNVNQVADSLSQAGIGSESAIGIFSHDCIEQLTTIFAVQKVGAKAISINPKLSADKVRHLLSSADADMLFYDPKEMETVDDLQKSTNTLSTEHYVSLTGDESNAITFESLLADGDDVEPDPSIDPDSTGLFLHTSGTTGDPKLVSLSHRSQWTNAMSCAVELDYQIGDTALHMAPIYHAAGYYNVFLPSVLLGSTNIIQPHFDAESSLRTIERESVNTFMGVRTHYKRLQKADISSYDLSSLRQILIGGTPLDPPTIDWARSNICDEFYNFYGLTESGTIAYGQLDSERISPGSYIGRPFLNMEVRIVDVGDDVSPDQTLEQGKQGELIARSPKIMNGYYNNQEKTDEALREDWLFTGDIAMQDEDGHYHLLNRMDDLIISGGENIYPREVEKALNKHPAVKESAAIGTEDDEFGERVVAYVVPTNDNLDGEELERYWLEDQRAVADYKRPRQYEFVDSLPKNSHGKIQRRKIPENDSE